MVGREAGVGERGELAGSNEGAGEKLTSPPIFVGRPLTWPQAESVDCCSLLPLLAVQLAGGNPLGPPKQRSRRLRAEEAIGRARVIGTAADPRAATGRERLLKRTALWVLRCSSWKGMQKAMPFTAAPGNAGGCLISIGAFCNLRLSILQDCYLPAGLGGIIQRGAWPRKEQQAGTCMGRVPAG